MDMNLHAVRDSGTPEIVLYQFDVDNPMNSHGLLIAYAEQTVKPVVSDFDTFLVGSRGMAYSELPDEQRNLAIWAVDKTKGILDIKRDASWTSQWLEILEREADSLSVEVPEYGFGDPISYNLIETVIEKTKDIGAVRHGAECFNFYFPQELDNEYLVIWDGFLSGGPEGRNEKAWSYMDPNSLYEFLSVRVEEGYCFPVNPVWVVRDPPWYRIFDQLRRDPTTRETFQAWYPEGSELVKLIDSIHADHPDGFSHVHHHHHQCEAGDDSDTDCCEDVSTEIHKICSLSKALSREKSLPTSVPSKKSTAAASNTGGYLRREKHRFKLLHRQIELLEDESSRLRKTASASRKS
eukprot:TRINITY_DN2277_c0_g4_i2.p1 TRINITY_DN2277_c0_g4~~TRINITY_DN2277_c0_g4_i2.p1  ORF type:complete len:369 (-),score=57.44 TRINITY_DN2277_c0_g4_i2:758-1810(-)